AVQSGIVNTPDGPVADVPDHANDGKMWDLVLHPDRKFCGERIDIRQVGLGKRLVHDEARRGSRIVGPRELASAEHGDPKRSKISGRDDTDDGGRPIIYRELRRAEAMEHRSSPG